MVLADSPAALAMLTLTLLNRHHCPQRPGAVFSIAIG